MNDHATAGSFSMSAQRTDSHRHSLRLFVVITLLVGLAGMTTALASDDIDIDRASWSSERNQLSVRGDNAPDNATVTILYPGNRVVLGTTQADSDGDWSFRLPGADPVPCRVRAEAGSSADERSVRRAPVDCSNDGGTPANQPPTANANGPYTGTTGAEISFSSAGSQDPDGSFVGYSWDFGDDTTSASANPSHSYAAAGSYTVVLTVTDNQGATASDSTTATITDTTACLEFDIDAVPNVSINSTAVSSNCQTTAPVTPVNPVTNKTETNGNSYSVLAINDLGMHCGDLDTRISSILPPFQVLLGQVIKRGDEPELNPADITLRYSAVANPNDPILGSPLDGTMTDGSTYKTNFWNTVINEGVYNAFYPFNIESMMSEDLGLPVPNVEELYIGHDGVVDSDCEQNPAGCDGTLVAVQHAMPGISSPYSANTPQDVQERFGDKPFFTNFPFGYVAEGVNWHEAAGIPFAAYDDFGRENAYPLVRVEARQGNTTVSTVDTVLPISGEASCTNCHATQEDYISVHGGSPTDTKHRSNDPTNALGSLPVATTMDDDAVGELPPKVSLEYAADLNILRLHDLKHGASYVSTDCDAPGQNCLSTASAPCDITANNGDGDASCLTNQALGGKPVVCQVCHYTPALDLAQVGPMAGDAANGRNQVAHSSNSNVMHGHHGQFDNLFPNIPAPVQLADGSIENHQARVDALEKNCYQCHPGTNVQCLRGAMFNGGMLCSDCHGDMAQVGADFSQNVSPTNPGAFVLDQGNFYDPDSNQPRVPWANEPGCGSCHTGDMNDNLVNSLDSIVNTRDIDGNVDGLRLRQAFRKGDAKATPIVPSNKRFAEPAVPTMYANADGSAFANPGAGNPQLYRVSTGHGGVMCEGCHGATHAEWPNANPNANDNVTANQLQGHTGPIVECDTCHTDVDNLTPNGRLSSLDKGPHGMHAVGDTEFARHNHKEELSGSDKDGCRACHGQNGEGTVLSRVATERVLECKETTELCPEGKDKPLVLQKGHAVGCSECHDNELSGNGD